MKKPEQENKTRIKKLLKARKELDQEFKNLLEKELTELENISQFSESVEQKLSEIYADIYPKKCRSCSSVYKSRDDYIKSTEGLKKASIVFNEIGLQEYRNCTCGSTLIIITEERRSLESYGKSRRKLFDDCMQKLTQISHLPEVQLKNKLRKIFSDFSA